MPRWYEMLEQQVEVGELEPNEMADAQLRASQAAIADMEAAGLDIVGGGEMHRRTNNRHAPPNAMLNHFWNRIPGFSPQTRPKPITPKNELVTHPGAVLTGEVGYGDLGLVEEFRMVSAFAHRPVKITMTGPHMLAAVAHDEHYAWLIASTAAATSSRPTAANSGSSTCTCSQPAACSSRKLAATSAPSCWTSPRCSTRVLQFFSGNIGLHHVQHLSARVPNSHLQRAHDENPIFYDVLVGTLGQGMLALRLKLWDEDHGRLVAFPRRSGNAGVARIPRV